MSWHPSRIETRIRPASRTPRWDYGSSTPLPDGIYRPSHSQSSRSKDKEQAEELKKYKRDSDPRTHLTEAQLRAKLEEARRRAEVEQARRGAEVEASDTDADDRRAEVQYDLGSDQPVFYTFGEVSRKGTVIRTPAATAYRTTSPRPFLETSRRRPAAYSKEPQCLAARITAPPPSITSLSRTTPVMDTRMAITRPS